jgi:hypothetical protein
MTDARYPAEGIKSCGLPKGASRELSSRYFFVCSEQ